MQSAGNASMTGTLRNRAGSAILAGAMLLGAGTQCYGDSRPVYNVKQDMVGCSGAAAELGNFQKSPASFSELREYHRKLASSNADAEVEYEADDGYLTVSRQNGEVRDNFVMPRDKIIEYSKGMEQYLRGEENTFSGSGAVMCAPRKGCSSMPSGRFPVQNGVRTNQPADALLMELAIWEMEGLKKIMTKPNEYTELSRGTAYYKGRPADAFEFRAGFTFDPARDERSYREFGPKTLSFCGWIYLDKERGVPLVIHANTGLFSCDIRASRISMPAADTFKKPALQKPGAAEPAQEQLQRSAYLPGGTVAFLEHLPVEKRAGGGVWNFLKGLFGFGGEEREAVNAPQTRVVAPDGRSWRFEGIAPLGFSPDGRFLYAMGTSYDEQTPGERDARLLLADLEAGAAESMPLPLDYSPALGYGHPTHNSQIGANLVTPAGCLVLRAEDGHGRIDLISYRHGAPDAKWSRLTSAGVVADFAVAEGAESLCYLLEDGGTMQQKVFCMELDDRCGNRAATEIRMEIPDRYRIKRYSNITISPDSMKAAITAFRIAPEAGELDEDEDIFAFIVPESSRSIIPSRIRTEPRGHIFDRVSTSRIPLSMSDVEQMVAEAFLYAPNKWRGRPMVMNNDGIIVFANDGSIYVAGMSGYVNRLASGTNILSYPLFAGNDVFFHSVPAPGGEVFEEGHSFELPGSIKRIRVYGGAEEELMKMRGISPLFVVYKAQAPAGTEKKIAGTEARAGTEGRRKEPGLIVQEKKRQEQPSLKPRSDEGFTDARDLPLQCDIRVNSRFIGNTTPAEWLNYIKGVYEQARGLAERNPGHIAFEAHCMGWLKEILGESYEGGSIMRREEWECDVARSIWVAEISELERIIEDRCGRYKSKIGLER